jgi:uncharacterized protein (DUF427 family)
VVEFAGETIAETRGALRLLETSHPPSYYFPPADVRLELLVPANGATWCEWKGRAVYLDVVAGGRSAHRAAWSYPDPEPSYAAIAGHFAFYPGAMDRCLVDGDVVRPQPGGFYGGWITADLAGPFKGGPGSQGW